MVKASFTYFFDIKTAKDVITKVNVVYGGRWPLNSFVDYFTRFKYYRPHSVKINVKPCATLPIDPSGLSYTEGEQTVDPRDIFSLGLVRITNGEFIPSLGTMSASEAHLFYNNMMLDKRWFKFSPHKGLVKTAIPKMWAISETSQDKFPGSVQNTPLIDYGGTQSGVPVGVGPESTVRFNYGKLGSQGQFGVNNTDTKNVQLKYGSYFNTFRLRQNGLEPVRWMPTDEYVRVEGVPADTTEGNALTIVNFKVFTIATPPEGSLMTLLFPPQYKTFNYFRVWVTETFEFKSYVNNIGSPVYNEQGEMQTSLPSALDRYIRPGMPIQADPVLTSDRLVVPKLR